MLELESLQFDVALVFVGRCESVTGVALVMLTCRLPPLLFKISSNSDSVFCDVPNGLNPLCTRALAGSTCVTGRCALSDWCGRDDHFNLIMLSAIPSAKLLLRQQPDAGGWASLKACEHLARHVHRRVCDSSRRWRAVAYIFGPACEADRKSHESTAWAAPYACRTCWCSFKMLQVLEVLNARRCRRRLICSSLIHTCHLQLTVIFTLPETPTQHLPVWSDPMRNFTCCMWTSCCAAIELWISPKLIRSQCLTVLWVTASAVFLWYSLKPV